MLGRRFLGLVAVASVSLFGTMGCSADLDEALGTEGSELVTLTAQQCQNPTVASSQLTDASGRPIFGTARGTINGCILGKTGETGSALLTRAQGILNDTARLSSIKDENGQKVFSRFSPLAVSGSGANTVQDIDVALNVQFNPSTRLRVTRRQEADGGFSVAITNVTPLKATVAFFPVTAVKENNLKVNVKIGAEANGVSVSGSGEVTLEQQKERAAESVQLVNQLFDWVTAELAR